MLNVFFRLKTNYLTCKGVWPFIFFQLTSTYFYESKATASWIFEWTIACNNKSPPILTGYNDPIINL